MGFMESVSILFHLSGYVLNLHNKMVMVGVKTRVGSENLKHIHAYILFSLIQGYMPSYMQQIFSFIVMPNGNLSCIMRTRRRDCADAPEHSLFPCVICNYLFKFDGYFFPVLKSDLLVPAEGSAIFHSGTPCRFLH